MSMIIIEGPDNAGKSTLAQQLSKAIGIPIHHSGGPALNDEEIIHRAERIFDTGNVRPLLYDRVPFISDYVYRTVMQDKPSPFTDKNLVDRYIRRMKKLHPVVILCWPPIPVMMALESHERSPHETEEHFNKVKDHQEQLIHSYSQLFVDIPHYKYDYTAPATEDQYATILLACIRHIGKE